MNLTEHLQHWQRPVSLALLGAAVLAVAILVVAPVAASIIDARDAIEMDRERLETLRTKRIDLAQLETALKETRTRQAGRPLIVEAPNAAVAFEKLEATIRNLSSQHEAPVNATRMLRLEDEIGLKAMRAEIDLMVSRVQVSGLVRALEQAAPLIFIERLSLVPADGGQGDNHVRMTAALRTLAAISAASVRK